MRQFFATLLLALAAGSAAADAPPRFGLSGFGTLGVVRSDKDDYHFRSSGTQSARGPGQNFDPSVDSVLGLQGTGHLHDQLDFTVQAISRQAVGYNYSPHITWAYLRYRATPALTVRVGRTTTPFFMFSDSLNVNFATPWVRPPPEVYNLNPFSDLDGIDLLYRIPVGEMDLEIQGFFGNSAVSARSASARLKNAKGINFGLVGSGFSAHAGYARTRLELQWDANFSQALTRLLNAVDENAELSGTKGTTEFFSAGFQWERNNWLIIAEFAKRRVDRYINSAHAWYVTTGYHFNNLTPYATYSQQIQDSPASGAKLKPTLMPLLDPRNNAQQGVALGVRWDIARNIALKSQIERIDAAPGSRGMFPSDVAADYLKPASPVHVFSMSVDFVF